MGLFVYFELFWLMVLYIQKYGYYGLNMNCPPTSSCTESTCSLVVVLFYVVLETLGGGA
jgi:hypothetical protein